MREKCTGTRSQPEQIADQLSVLSLAEVQALAEQGYTTIPLVERLDQKETAGSLYEKLRGNEPSFLLESLEMDERQGRYSFIGIAPGMIIRLEKEGMFVNGEEQDFDDPYAFVDGLISQRSIAPVEDLPPMFGGAAGLFGYDLARYREPTIGQAKPDSLGLPQMALIVPGVVISVDHYKQEVSIIRNLIVDGQADEQSLADQYQRAVDKLQEAKRRITAPASSIVAESPPPKLSFKSNFTKAEFEQAVDTAKEYCYAGDVFQVVPSQRFSSDQPVSKDFAHEVNKRLKRLNPSRYAFLFEFEDFQVTGCSPETLVKVSDRQIEHMAIAGTRKRGGSPRR